MYTVELNFSDPARAEEWHAWYETYLAQLVLVPGLSTAQRFRAVAPRTPSWAYVALYSVASLDVFASDAYRRIGGGGQASARFKEAIRRRRNVYAGIERVPEVTDAGCVVLCDDMRHTWHLADCLFVPLKAAAGRRQAGATALDGEPSRRALAVIAAETVDRLNLTGTEGLAVYTPITKRYVAPEADGKAPGSRRPPGEPGWHGTPPATRKRYRTLALRHALLPRASRGVLQTRYPAASLALCAVAHPGVFAIWTLVGQPCIPSSV